MNNVAVLFCTISSGFIFSSTEKASGLEAHNYGE